MAYGTNTTIPMGIHAFSTFEPQGTYYLVRRIQHTETKSGLVLPGEAGKDFQPYCEIVAAGPGRHDGERFVEMLYKPGDFIQIEGSYCMQGHVCHFAGQDHPEVLFTADQSRILGRVTIRKDDAA